VTNNTEPRPYWQLCEMAHTSLEALDFFYTPEQFVERAAYFGETIAIEEAIASWQEFKNRPRDGRTFQIRL
jgi:hypothetical protein